MAMILFPVQQSGKSVAIAMELHKMCCLLKKGESLEIRPHPGKELSSAYLVTRRKLVSAPEIDGFGPEDIIDVKDFIKRPLEKS